MVVNVSNSDAQACVARGDVLMRAIGFPISSPLPTTQSSAFFRAPGIRRVLRAGDQHGITRVQPAPKCRDRLGRALLIEIGIERRKFGERVDDRYLDARRRKARRRCNQRAVRGLAPQAAGNCCDTNVSESIPRYGTTPAGAGRIPRLAWPGLLFRMALVQTREGKRRDGCVPGRSMTQPLLRSRIVPNHGDELRQVTRQGLGNRWPQPASCRVCRSICRSPIEIERCDACRLGASCNA